MHSIATSRVLSVNVTAPTGNELDPVTYNGSYTHTLMKLGLRNPQFWEMSLQRQTPFPLLGGGYFLFAWRHWWSCLKQLPCRALLTLLTNYTHCLPSLQNSVTTLTFPESEVQNVTHEELHIHQKVYVFFLICVCISVWLWVEFVEEWYMKVSGKYSWRRWN